MKWVVPRTVNSAADFVRAVRRETSEKNVAFLAGSIAYSAFVSLFPLLLLLLLVATIVGGQMFAIYVVNLTQNYLTPTGQQLLIQSITRAAGRAELSLLSVVVLVWGMLGLFRGLDTAFSVLYGTSANDSIVDQARDGVIVFLAIGAATAAMIAAGAVFALFPGHPYLRVLNPLLLIIGLSIAFFPIYYVFPDTDVSVREVLPGTLVAAVGWAALQVLFQLYVSASSKAELYGVIGGVLLLITWLYFGALILLIGGAVNVVLAGQSRIVSVEPVAS